MESNFKQKELKEFSSLLEDAPALCLLNISNGVNPFLSILEDKISKNDGTIESRDLNNISCDKFRLKSREFEYCILFDTISLCEDKEKFIKTCYHSLENSAFIIIIEPKSSNNISEVIELLDLCEFRVANNIDIFDDYNLIMAKKLHMWGNGL